MKLSKIASVVILATTVLTACGDKNEQQAAAQHALVSEYNDRLDIYKTIELTADLSHLSAKQKQMLSLLIEASEIMDDLFWQQAYGKDKDKFLAGITDEKVKTFAEINYGPWDRLDGDKPFLTNVDSKSHGAQFYPSDMTKEEYEKADPWSTTAFRFYIPPPPCAENRCATPCLSRQSRPCARLRLRGR